MSSPLQVTANRANALKSTGPRTPAGKAAASRNALKHGVHSWQPVLLPGETAAAWRDFARAVVLDLAPRGPVEAMHAGRIALLLWRLQRLARHQSALAHHIQRGAELAAPKSPLWKQRKQADPAFPDSLDHLLSTLPKGLDEAIRRAHASLTSAGLELSRFRRLGPLRSLKPIAAARRYESSLERSLSRSLQQYAILQAARPIPPADPPVDATPSPAQPLPHPPSSPIQPPVNPSATFAISPEIPA